MTCTECFFKEHGMSVETLLPNSIPAAEVIVSAALY